ncbi:MAG: hypothetical protein ACREFI_15090, partial [Stellaceae bacterium]
IEAIAPIPDDPPVQFRWRRLTYRIRAADGPERILGEWWRSPEDATPASRVGVAARSRRTNEPELRDYYAVEDTDGRRFWVFREGLHKPGVTPGWFLHGVFP